MKHTAEDIFRIVHKKGLEKERLYFILDELAEAIRAFGFIDCENTTEVYWDNGSLFMRRIKKDEMLPKDGRTNRPVFIKINAERVLAISDGNGNAYKVYGEGYDVFDSVCKPENMYDPKDYTFERGLSGMDF